MSLVSSIVKKPSGIWWVYRTTPATHVDVWQDGEKVITDSHDDPLVISWPYDGPPEIEVVATGTTTHNSAIFAPFIRLQWRFVTGADFYLIQAYEGSAWRTIDRMVADDRGYFSWKSPRLDDSVTAAYQVVAVSGGVSAAVAGVSRRILCPPKTPNFSVAIDEDGKLVIDLI